MRSECTREQDVMDAVAARRWPSSDAAHDEPGLREHIAGCTICGDLAVVLSAMGEERDAAWEEAAVPPAAVVWWRAQIRARDEAASAAARPILAAQAVALSCLVGAGLALLPLAWPVMERLLLGVPDLAAWALPRAAAVSNAFTLVTGTALPLLPFAAVSVLLAPVLLYYALTEE